jgi:hypothetical protein
MSFRNSQPERKQLRVSSRKYGYNTDTCEQCGNEVDISELHIPTGHCGTCYKSDKDSMRKMIERCDDFILYGK